MVTRKVMSLLCLLMLAVMVGSMQSLAEANGKDIDARTEEILYSMTNEQKVGQLFMVGLEGTELLPKEKELIESKHVGGIIIYDRNMKNKIHVREFMKKVQDTSLENKQFGNLPLFVAIDEEGGKVSRMADKLTPPPAQEDVALKGGPELAKKYAQDIAEELKYMGVNVNYAPVADVGRDLVKRRDYSTDPHVVTQYVDQAVSGYEAENLICCIKHFPGIGRGKADSHKGFVNVSATWDELQATDLMPFKATIKNHDNENFMVMVAHVTYSNIDPDTPASLSKYFMTDVLRNQLGYTGIVVSDELNMGAIAKYYDYDTVGLMSFQAGADMLIICHEYDRIDKVYNSLLRGLKTDAITQERLDQSVRRIIKAKLKIAE